MKMIRIMAQAVRITKHTPQAGTIVSALGNLMSKADL